MAARPPAWLTASKETNQTSVGPFGWPTNSMTVQKLHTIHLQTRLHTTAHPSGQSTHPDSQSRLHRTDLARTRASQQNPLGSRILNRIETEFNLHRPPAPEGKAEERVRKSHIGCIQPPSRKNSVGDSFHGTPPLTGKGGGEKTPHSHYLPVRESDCERACVRVFLPALQCH